MLSHQSPLSTFAHSVRARPITLPRAVYTVTQKTSPASPHAKREGLTPRQLQVCILVAEGKRNKEIADALRISEGTVKVYMSKILRRVEVKNRTQLALWYLARES